jgi:hypothetical protein
MGDGGGGGGGGAGGSGAVNGAKEMLEGVLVTGWSSHSGAFCPLVQS